LALDEDLAFDALYADVGPRLWRAVLAYTGGARDLTDDVVAEAFARTLERGAAVRDRQAYLFRVAFRLAARELGRQPTVGEVPDAGTWDDPGLAEVFDALRGALARPARRAVPAVPGRPPGPRGGQADGDILRRGPDAPDARAAATGRRAGRRR